MRRRSPLPTRVAAALALAALPWLARAAGAQRRPAADSARRDTVAARLPAVEVLGSILPAMGPAVGSGVPARTAILASSDIEAWAPRRLTGALGAERGAWAVTAVVRNALGRDHATFGTFNVNQGNGDALEPVLTPAEPRSVLLVLRRAFGATG